jgi:flagellar hook-length control protein FliK
MLKLERQAIATSADTPADLQVLRIGNKLNVITTDAPLPDIASLAQFARAQGLGESAVQALFGTGVPLISAPAPAELDLTVGINGAGLTFTSGVENSAQAAALAQAAVTAMTAAASSQTGASLQMSLANKAMSLQASLPTTVISALGASATQAEPQLAMTAQKDVDMRTLATQDALQLGSIAATAQALETAKTAKSETKAAIADQRNGNSGASLLESFLAERTLLGTVKIQTAAPLVKGPVPTANPLHNEAELALAAAIQAGSGLVPQAVPIDAVNGQDAVVDADQTVTIRSLSVQSAGVALITPGLDTGRTQSQIQLGQTDVNAPTNAGAAETQGITQSTDAAQEAQAALQLRLIPPDQAITKRLAQIAGTAKPIDWSALLAGQKVSDTLSAMAKSPSPALSDAQAKVLTQMQANGQLPPSADEARNALLAKVQAQAAKMSAFGVPSVTAPAAPAVAITGAKPTAMTQGALLASVRDSRLLQLDNPVQNAAASLAPPPGPAQGPSHSLWETVRIEVPSGLALEALQASKNQKSDAEPELPVAPGTAQATGPASLAPATAKAEAATPQALAEQRAAQYQEIADQMGEAMARRLMAQIERGQWKMQLRMQPSALGRIDVELNMHKSGLDATFSADNAVTRELMAQGSARLRDTLTQSGTTVASVIVNGDSGRQSGGNSTPGRKSKDEQSANSKKSAAAAVATVAAKAPVDQGDGLNLLA